MKDFKKMERYLRSNKILFGLVAEKLGITEKALHLKLLSPMTFTLGEISLLKNIFNLSPRQTLNFFIPRVAYCNLSRF